MAEWRKRKKDAASENATSPGLEPLMLDCVRGRPSRPWRQREGPKPFTVQVAEACSVPVANLLLFSFYLCTLCLIL